MFNSPSQDDLLTDTSLDIELTRKNESVSTFITSNYVVDSGVVLSYLKLKLAQ